jgi:inner membrane protein
MSPVTHFLLGWVTANASDLNRRDRAIVTIAGIIPDLDGLGIVVEIATRQSVKPLTWWSDYHHVLGHNFGFCFLVVLLATFFAAQKWKAATFACLSFHLHLFCDLIGARGPDLHQWPIPYLLPFSNAWQWTWSGQWALSAWPNMLITVIALAITFRLAWKRGYSPLEMISSKADQAFIAALRHRIPLASS